PRVLGQPLRGRRTVRASRRPRAELMAGKRAETLLEMMLFIEMYTLRRAWTDLTDDELLCEPTQAAWTVHRAAHHRTPQPFVNGDLAAAFEFVAVEPLPPIAWLFWHAGSQPGRAAELDFFGGSHTAASGWTSPYLVAHPMFTTADAAVGSMQTGWRALDN